MRLEAFEYLLPDAFDEALRLKARYGAEAAVLAGGTDLLLKLRGGEQMPRYVISLKKLTRELRYIRRTDSGIDIGPLATHDDLDLSAPLREDCAALPEAAALVGSPQIRHAGTLGGNLCSALPSADTAPPVIVLGGELTLKSLHGERTIPAEQFFTAPGKSVLRDNELLWAAHLPPKAPDSGSAYIKFGRRQALEIAIAGAAAYVELESGGDVMSNVRIALTSSGPVPWRCKDAEALLRGQRVTRALLREAGSRAALEAKPRSSFRSTEEYRRHLLPGLVCRALDTACERAYCRIPQ